MAKLPQRDLIRETRREFRRVKAELEPRLLAEAQEPGKAHLANEEMRNIIVAQNVLRPSLEAVVECLIPFSHLTALELAIRMASYVLSITPMEDQAKLVALFQQSFPNAHDMRLAQGVVIKTEWANDGEAPIANHPEGPITDPKGNV